MTMQLRAGFSEVDITPDGREVELAGQYYQRLATEIHSRLKATVLVLEQDGQCSAFVTLDVLSMPRKMAQRLARAMAAAVPQLSQDRIIINVTHTHSAPALVRSRNWWETSPQAITCDEFVALVESQLVAGVKEAHEARQPAGMAAVTEFASVGHCRRPFYQDGVARMYGATDRADFAGLEGGEDAGVELMFFTDTNKRPLGVIVNVACPSQVMEATYKISSDFMGALREKLKTVFGPSFKTLPQISAAGCQSPRDLTRHDQAQVDLWNEAGVATIANRLAQAVEQGWAAASETITDAPLFAHQQMTLKLPKRRVSKPAFLEAKREMERLEAIQDSVSAYRDFCDQIKANEKTAGRPGPNDDKDHHFVLIRNNEAVIKRYEEQAQEPDVETDIHLVCLGDVVFATNPFELYLEFGQRIKARSKARQTFLVQLACGCESYLPSTAAEKFGGYGGLIINGKCGSDGGNQLVDATVDGIMKLFASTAD